MGLSMRSTYEEGGKEVTKKDRFEGIKGLTERRHPLARLSPISREAVRDVELKLLEARNLSVHTGSGTELP
jgi:hypothetical protein